MASSTKVSVKLFHDGVFRRFELEATDSGDLFAALRAKINVLVPGFDKNIAWKDADDDLIILSTDSEVREAIRAATDGLLRIYTGQQEEGKAPQQPEAPHTHSGVVCDGCNGAVVGFRYKCVECQDFDLCGTCEAKGTHGEHCIVRMSDPNDKKWKWVYMASRWMSNMRDGKQRGEHGCGSPWWMFGAQQPKPEEAGAAVGEPQSHDQFLKDVGANVATVLGNMGIDVDAEVVQNMGKQDEKPMETQTQCKQTEEARIKETVTNLMGMGFTNEGGWLTNLVKYKHGDINAALNVLHRRF